MTDQKEGTKMTGGSSVVRRRGTHNIDADKQGEEKEDEEVSQSHSRDLCLLSDLCFFF